MKRIAVIDLGTGNLRSVARALETAAGGGCDVHVTSDAGEVARADKVVFPGQSAIASVMERLRGEPSLLQALLEALDSKPFLGICIGLQALYAHSSEDGGVEGLGILQGEVRHFLEARRDDAGAFTDPGTGVKLKIPHMGWNNLRQVRTHRLLRGIDQDAWFYFVHSYCSFSGPADEVYGTTTYGLDFDAAAGRGNVFAVQFHPEKSQRNGLKLLGNFVAWDGTP
jgi:glutamine amidotransferase